MSGTDLAEVLDRVEKIADVVRDGAAESERLGRLAPAVIAALADSGLLQTFVPADLGGLGLTIPEGLQVFERVSEFDASTGWTLTLLCSGALFARFCPAETFATICREHGALVAGTLNPSTAGAEPVDGGFLFSGRATYLSGSAHARLVMASAFVTKDGVPDFSTGLPQIRTGFFPIEHARSLDTWNVMGMRATASSDYEFDQVMVPADWTFEPMHPRVTGPGDDVFGAIPLWGQLGGLAAVTVGTARNMIDRFVELAAAKVPVGGMTRLAERPGAQIAVAEAEGLYQAARAVLRETVAATWARGVAAEPFDNETLARSRAGGVTAVRLAAQAADLIHDAAGMSSIMQDTVLERCWRDMHTMTQHIILSPARYEIVGRVLFGLDPGSPVI